MSKTQRRSTQHLQKPQRARSVPWPQLAIVSGVAVLVAAILLMKDPPADPPAVTQSGPRATATVPEAVGQTEATAELAQVHSQPATSGAQGATLPDELPEAQLDRLLAAGQPTLAFFHSNNCIQCIKMMEVVEEVYPEFDESVALVDVNVYDKANEVLLQRAQIHAIPTQVFIDRTGQGRVIMGAMTPDEFREQMQTLAGGE